MRKLFSLKSWFTLFDASLYLSSSLGEPVSESDILRLALDHKLRLSVIFVDGALASLLTPVAESEIEYNEVPTLNGKGTLKLAANGPVVYTASGAALQSQDDRVFWLEDEEPYDLMMMGGERADVQRRFWTLANMAMEESTNIDGTFVSGGGRFFQLMAPHTTRESGHYPIGSLPEGAVFVLRRESIAALLKSLEPNEAAGDAIARNTAASDERALQTKERNSLLSIIGLVAEIAKLELREVSKAAQVVESAAELKGLKLSRRAIEEHLKKVPAAMNHLTR
jgi:hypothetical protein